LTLDLHGPDNDTPSRSRGSVTIRLEVDLMLNAVWKADNGVGPRTAEDLTRTGIVREILQSDLYNASPQWTSLLMSLKTLVDLAGGFSQVRVLLSLTAVG
jgi:hypothetical protein